MADNSELERTQPASSRRLEQAREEGQVARSQELGTFGVIAAGAGALWLTGGTLVDGLAGVMRAGLSIPTALATDPALLVPQLGALGVEALRVTAPLAGLVFVAALAVPLALSGWVFSSRLPAPDFSRLDPLDGIRRIFSSRGVAELGKALAKALLVGGVGGWVVWQYRDSLLGLAAMPFASAVATLERVAGLSLLALAGALLAIVAIDVPYQIWQHAQRLRMTHEEVRRENKETEGDPQIRARVRSLQREAARKRMMSEVPKATVVVTNPTHYAVALFYRENSSGAPRVVAKGSHLLAQRIRDIAVEHRVPILEAPPLARALYRHVELGAEIPERLYSVVAEVLVYVFRLRHYMNYGGLAPRMPQALPVPADLDAEAEHR
ncbi:MAG TPA: flagellar biosynthesis protein FlhB [Burkholderiales bacterium]|nr:flagellar biosynthesis protein FlhB [Burkholderiales bacterium]